MLTACRDGPSQLLSQPDDNIWELEQWDSSRITALNPTHYSTFPLPKPCKTPPDCNDNRQLPAEMAPVSC
jgi:hypothetical protein